LQLAVVAAAIGASAVRLIHDGSFWPLVLSLIAGPPAVWTYVTTRRMRDLDLPVAAELKVVFFLVATVVWGLSLIALLLLLPGRSIP
jgi:hypothetical protein